MQAPVHHVAHVTECLAGGTLVVLRQLVGELARSHVRQTLIYSRRPDSPREISSLFPDAVHLIEIRPARRSHADFISDLVHVLADLLAADPPDVVHLHSSKAGFIGRLAVRAIDARHRTRTRLLYSPHGLAFLNSRRPLASACYWALERIAGMVDCQPVGCGASEAQALAGVNRRAARVLENPVDPAFLEIVRREPKRPVVLSVGRLCEQKAPEIFAELAVRARVDAEDARFIWVGAGDRAREAMLRAVGVEVTGWLPQEEVRTRLAEAIVYLQTSRWEGLPLSVLQAMAAGLPCLVLDAVGNRDAIEHEVSGLLGHDIDELEMYLSMLLANPPLRARLATQARLRAQDRFSLTRFRAALLDLYGVREPAPRPRDLGPAAAPATLA
jgi:glycosyltransferase involved in cell wall biosynthesis